MQCNVKKSCAEDQTASLILTKVMLLHSVISKSCTLLTSFLLLGYLVCKIFSIFWSAPCSSYTRLQSISFSCWLTTNVNLRLAPHTIKQLPGHYQWQSPSWGEPPPPSPQAQRPQRAVGWRDQGSTAPQAGETHASQLSGLSRCLLLPKTLPGRGAASHGRRSQQDHMVLLQARGPQELGHGCNSCTWPLCFLDISLSLRNVLGECYC